jgi:hypothetical protein
VSKAADLHGNNVACYFTLVKLISPA